MPNTNFRGKQQEGGQKGPGTSVPRSATEHKASLPGSAGNTSSGCSTSHKRDKQG